VLPLVVVSDEHEGIASGVEQDRKTVKSNVR
jgi:hypothetical protein